MRRIFVTLALLFPLCAYAQDYMFESRLVADTSDIEYDTRVSWISAVERNHEVRAWKRSFNYYSDTVFVCLNLSDTKVIEFSDTLTCAEVKNRANSISHFIGSFCTD